jgi:hypothetical protein
VLFYFFLQHSPPLSQHLWPGRGHSDVCGSTTLG